MFQRVLIANRGEIAVRVCRTLRRMGITTIAVYSDADRTGLHVRSADEAYRIGGPEARESYLNVEAILAAARASAAQAIHPGYGFLSENAAFAEAVGAAGLTWIGPPPAAIAAMGDKAAAKQLVAAAGVPVVPGYDGDDQSNDRLAAEAARTGYPLLIKASAGGGGRGMREVHAPEEFQAQLDSARREAKSSFGDDRVLLERLVIGARHVELQVFGDRHGSVIYLGERDCSVQRRHQKVIEEAPSPAVDSALRQRMGAAAVRAAARVGYTNAGTVEFLLAPDGQFYFLEMNTRLQVEHPVTELVTGLDLVEWQLRVAAGETLPLSQEQVQLSGHAIEARLYAEDPSRGYLPSIGRLAELRFPSLAGVRVDTGFTSGDAVSPYYDAMLAKLIAYAPSRDEAIDRLNGALGATVVEGLQSNRDQLRAILSGPVFRAGGATTDYLDAVWPVGPSEGIAPAPQVPREVLLAAAGFLLAPGHAALGGGVWNAGGAWRVAPASRILRFEAAGYRYDVAAEPADEPAAWRLTLDGETAIASFERAGTDTLLMTEGTRAVPVQTGVDADGGLRLILHGDSYTLQPVTVPPPDAGSAAMSEGGSSRLTAPLPGVIAKVLVQPGERVRRHQTVIVLEAMKMEHAIESPIDGVVKELHAEEGQRVSGGALLAEIGEEENA